MNNFDNIKKFREQNNLTQKQLSEICGVTLRTVQNWEAGKTIPDNIVKLLRSLSSKSENISSSLCFNVDESNTIDSPSVQQRSYGKNSPNVNGNINHVGGCTAIDRAFTSIQTSLAQSEAMLKTLDTALAEIAEQRKLVAQSMAQTAMLIQFIQNQK